ncbi:MAG TPA: Dps family protein [Polyangiaceae bacterium]|nr:Dps family protein [Polyangiaceae bacterium]
MKPLNIGLSEEQRTTSIERLNGSLSDLYLLLIKTKKFHWDVVGPQFMTLHKLWDEQYQKIELEIDEVAERVRALGGYPVGTAAGFLRHAKVKEYPGQVSSATESVAALVDDHELVVRTMRESIEACEGAKDRGSADFFTRMMQAHEDMAWMLRSFLEGDRVRSDGQRPAPRAVPHEA